MLFINSIFVMVSHTQCNSDNNSEKEISTLDMYILDNITSESLKTQAYICSLDFCRVSKYSKMQAHLTHLFSFCHCFSLV